MRHFRSAATALAASTLFAVGISVAGGPVAAAQPGDFGGLPINPNDITDDDCVFMTTSTTPNPNGQAGVETVYTHRDGTRQIIDTIQIFPDPGAATSALDAATAALGSQVPGAVPQPAPVGSGGTVVTGLTPDRSQSLGVLVFTQGNALTTIKFQGPPNDPASVEQIIDVGQTQANEIING